MADDPTPINADYSVNGQITFEQIKEAADQGFQSILNLRSPDEPGFIADEADYATAVELDYANTPVDAVQADLEQLQSALSTLGSLPKPVLVHCRGGIRASTVTLMAIALQENLSFGSFLQKAKELEIDPNHPHIQHFIQERYPNHGSPS